jgi:acyl dehydratase
MIPRPPCPSASGLAIPSSILGREAGPFRAAIDARWLMAYAAAAGLRHPSYFDTTTADGPLAHPLFPVCYEWPLLVDIRDRAIGEAAAPFGVHASHRLVLHRLPRAGDIVTTAARVLSVTSRRSGTLVTVRLATTDEQGRLVSETDYGSLYRGVPLAGAALAETPLRRAEPVERRPRWSERVDVPYHLAHVYTECARIWNPIHTDLAAARAAGLPVPILHGTATLALAVSQLVDRDLQGDARAVRGIEARFAGMVVLPSIFTVCAGGRQPEAIAFEAVAADGSRVLSEGVLRL